MVGNFRRRRRLFSSRQTTDSSAGSTSGASRSPWPRKPARGALTKRMIWLTTSSETSAPPGLRIASRACSPLMRVSRMRLRMIAGMRPRRPSNSAR